MAHNAHPFLFSQAVGKCFPL